MPNRDIVDNGIQKLTNCLNQVLRAGERAVRSRLFYKVALEREIEERVYRLYEPTAEEIRIVEGTA